MFRKALGTIIGGVLALVLVGFVPHARADAFNQLTKFTFSQPVQLPHNEVLPAGTYWFRELDPVRNSQVVQVFNADRTKLLGTFLTITNDRPVNNPSGTTQLTLAKISNRQPDLMVGWIYPGQTQGHQFIYSAQQENRVSENGKLMTVQIPDGGRVNVG